MKAPKNRRVFAIGQAAITPLGATAEATWQRAVANQAGFRELSRCSVGCRTIVGEIPDRDSTSYAFDTPRERHNWSAAYVLETIAVCQDALRDALEASPGPRHEGEAPLASTVKLCPDDKALVARRSLEDAEDGGIEESGGIRDEHQGR